MWEVPKLSKARKTTVLILTAAFIAAAAFLFLKAEPETPTGAETASLESPAEPESLAGQTAFESEDVQTQAFEPSESVEQVRPMGDAEASRVRERVVAQVAFPHDMAMDEYKSALWNDIQANPPALATPGDPAVDADMAYRLYMYFGNCSMSPRTENAVNRSLDRIVARAEYAREGSLDRLEQWADRTISLYELCASIPPEVDCRLEAVHWMSEAVRLGHEIALVQFYEKSMGFILRSDRFTDAPPLVMTEPGIVEQFKSTARLALNRALENGHPEAYLAMSQAVLEGAIYPKDPILAMAYVRAAEFAAMDNRIILERLERQKYLASQNLTPDQIAQAEEIALELRTAANT
jgi:TPR repeat protein